MYTMIPLRLHFLSAVKTLGGEGGRYFPIFRDFPKLLSNFQIKDFGWDECNCGHSLWNASRHVLIWAYNMARFPVYISKQWSPEARSIVVRLWSSSSYSSSIVRFLQIICFCWTQIPCSAEVVCDDRKNDHCKKSFEIQVAPLPDACSMFSGIGLHVNSLKIFVEDICISSLWNGFA